MKNEGLKDKIEMTKEEIESKGYKELIQLLKNTKSFTDKTYGLLQDEYIKKYYKGIE